MGNEGHRERIRQRFEREGLEGFTPTEALELLLTYALPRVDTKPHAKALLAHFGSLARVLEATPAELIQVPGIGPRAADLLCLILPLTQRYQQEKLLPLLKIGTYASLAAYCRTLYLGADCEKLFLLCLDGGLNLLNTRLLCQGTATDIQVEPQLVVKELLRSGASGAVLTHNHPSGNPMPSQADVDFTLRLKALLEEMRIPLYDHVIIAKDRDYSFRTHNWFQPPAEEDSPALVADNPLGGSSHRPRKKR